MSTITISIAEAGTSAMRTFNFSIFLNSQAILIDQSLSPVESQEVHEISRQYASLFEKGCKAEVGRDYLELLGKELFHLWFEKAGDRIKAENLEDAMLIVASDIQNILSLPWELILTTEGTVLGFNPKFSIRRLPKASNSLAVFSGHLPDGPLRVLFMACAPLDYEKEERSVLQAMEGLETYFRIGNTGSFEELVQLIEDFSPQIVHLIGQGKVKDGAAFFSFESEGGSPDLRPSWEIGQVLAKGEVQCAIVSGCQINTPFFLDLVCHDLANFIPLTIGWNATASDFARLFYGPVVTGQTIDSALAKARFEALQLCNEQKKLNALPVLYSATDQALVLGPQTQTSIPHKNEKVLLPLTGLIEGHAENFVNRRRELQRLTSALREGTARTVVITGQNGAGKSTLAEELALRLESEGYTLIPVYSSEHNPLSSARLMESAILALSKAGLGEETKELRDPSVDLGKRLKSMLDLLNQRHFLLVLDDLGLDKATGKIKDSELAEFYIHMLNQIGGSRAIVTSPVLPADALTLPHRAWEWPLSGLSEAAFVKFLLSNEIVAARYKRGEIQYELLQKLHALMAGIPFCINQMRKALRTEKENLNLCDEVLQKLYGSLSPESSLALSQAAVYGSAVSLTEPAAVVRGSEGMALSFVKKWQDLSLVYQVRGTLWAIPSSSRPWLLTKLAPDQLKAAHKAAGNFLMDIAERGSSSVLELSRLDCLMEARGQYLASDELDLARATTARISAYLERRGYYYEIIRLNEELLGRERHAAPMNWIARAHMDQGKYPEAQEWYQHSIESGPEAVACHGLGMVYFRQGKYDQARKSFQKAAEICRTSGDSEGEAAALHGLASIDMERRENDAARRKLQKVMDIQEGLGNFKGEAATLHDLAMLDRRQGDYKAARKNLLKSLEILHQVSDWLGEASTLYNLASIDLEKGDYELAREEFQNALAIKEKLGDKSGEAAILHSLGSIDLQGGDLDKARENFQKALEIYQKLGDKEGEAGAFFQLGMLAVQRGRIPEGLRLMALSAIVLRSSGSEAIRRVEPVVERLAAQMNYTQTQFMRMVQEATLAYRKDRGGTLIEAAFGSEKQ